MQGDLYQSDEARPSADVSLSAPPASPDADSGAVVHVDGVTVAIGREDTRPTNPVRELLDPARLDEYREAYLHEHQPVGPTEHSIVRELAQHAAAMDLWNEAIGAIERQGAWELPEFARVAGENGSTLDDAILAGTMAQETVDRCEKHLRSHSRAFYRALGKLEELQTRRKKFDAGELVIPPTPFTTEAACENHLRDRFKAGTRPCPRCGGVGGHYIATRRCWECTGCGCQTGLRHGTVMADSPIPLTKWFTAIWLLLWRPTITTAELVSTLGINRVVTTRNMANKIRAAVAAVNASDLVAGLDAYYATCRATPPEASAPEGRNASLSNASP